MSTFYEPGKYEVEATSQGFTETSTLKPQFVLKFKILGKVDPTDASTLITVPAQYERTYYRVLTDNTIEYFTKDLETLGVEIASFSDLDPSNPNHTSLVGKVFEAFCNHENNQKGERQEKWSIARKAGESKPVESVDSSKVKALDRMFGRHLKKAGTAVASSGRKALGLLPYAHPQEMVTERSKEIDDSDIPF